MTILMWSALADNRCHDENRQGRDHGNVHGHAPVIQPGGLPIFGVEGFSHQIEAFFVQAEYLFHFDQGLFGHAVAVALLQDQVDEECREQGGAGNGKDLDGEMHGPRRGKRENRDEEQDQKRAAEGRQAHHQFPAAEHFFFIPGVENPKDFELFFA